jgi:hypothetical protein
MLLLAASALGQSPKKPKKKQPAQATQQASPCGVDGDGNPIPPANCAGAQPVATQLSPGPQPPPTPQPPPAPQPPPTPQPTDTSSSVCLASNPGASDSIEMTAVGGEATYSLQNPMKGTKSSITNVSWLTKHELQQMQPNATAPFQPISDSKPFPFKLRYCGPNPNDSTKPLIKELVFGSNLQDFASAETIIIDFVSKEVGRLTQYLQLQWKPDGKTDTTKRYEVTVKSDAPDYANDSRYKLWAYTGYTYLRSKNDFHDGFAELLMRFETRWLDERIAMFDHNEDLYNEAVQSGHRCDRSREINKLRKEVSQKLTEAQENETTAAVNALNAANQKLADARRLAKATGDCPTATFWIVRGYGEAGLTGTAVVASSSQNQPNQTEIGGVTQAFGGGVGLGIGKTLLVSRVKETDTRAFSILLLPRLGMISIPAATDPTTHNPIPNTAFSAFNYSLNFRFENEQALTKEDRVLTKDEKVKGGNFEGAYAEIGWGESEQFSRKKFPRLRFDGLVPIPAGSELFRLALRLQIDAARPFSSKKPDVPDNLASEIRISALFNMDIFELFRRIGGGK